MFDYSRPVVAAFLDELLEALEVTEPVVLVVHDIGGVVGIPWAARNLDRIRGLVLTNTVVFEHFAWFGPARLWARTDPIGRIAAAASMSQIGWFGGRIFRTFFHRISPELPVPDLDRMTHHFARDPKSKRSTLRLFQQMVPEAYFSGMDVMLRTLIDRVPVHVVWSAGEPYIPAHYAHAFLGAMFEINPQGGHWIPISTGARVGAAVTSTFASVHAVSI